MDEITQAQVALDEAREALRRAVRSGRRSGRTWADIGAALGMSRQAAFKRFGDVTDPVDGRRMKGIRMSTAQITAITEQVFAHIAAGDQVSLQQMLHPEVRSELTPEAIAETWARVLADIGALESQTDTHVVFPAGERIDDDEQVLGTVVGVTTLRHEAGELMGRVAVDQDRQVVGLLIVPLGQDQLPF